MKIFHVINTLEIGGAQSLLLNLIDHWGDEGDSHTIISLMPKTDSAGVFEETGIPIIYLNMEEAKFSLKNFLALIHIIRTAQPDVVQTWLYHSDLLGGVASWLAGVKSIVWGVHHTITNDTALKPTTRMVLKLLVFFSHFLPKKIICCSESAVTTHVSLGYPQEKMITITNGVDYDRFHPDVSARKSLREELGLPLTERLVGMFARYHPQKDHANFIHAAALLSKKYADVHFILSGENVDESNPDLTSLIVNSGIGDRVHLLGKRQDMPRLHAAMDINSLSSSFGEALPMALCEGMSCGVPCVATRVGDVESLIDNTGKVVEPGNPNALAEAWLSILELGPVEYNELSNKARQRILLYYGLSGTVNLYQQIYKQVMIIK